MPGVSRKPLLPAILTAAVALAGCAAFAQQPTEVQRLQARAAYERGVAHLDRKEAAAALMALQEAVAIDGTVGLYRDALGLVLLNELGRPDLALAEFERAVQIDPTHGDVQFHRGVALAEVTRWEEAIGAYRRALNLPTLTVPHLVHHNLGVALYNVKRYREAEEHLRFALSLEPQTQGAYYNLGLLLAAENRLEEARMAFRRARDLGPESPFGRAAAERLRALGDGG